MATDPRASVKARLTSSLFNTRGEDGNRTSCPVEDIADGLAVEQYITHVKITEDSAHPSTPPPNGADISNRKQRCIVVSGSSQKVLTVDICSPKKWDSKNAQDTRELKRDFFNWKDLECGST